MRRLRDRSLLFAASLILASLPLSAQAETSRLGDAIAARDRGDFTRAIALLRLEAQEHPADADILRMLGTTLAFAGRYPEAIDTLQRARALSPRDQDIALALSRAMLWSGHWRDSDRVAREIAVSDPGNAELAELVRSIEAARLEGPAVTADLAQKFSRVAIGSFKTHWTETIATLNVPLGSRTSLAGNIDREDRSGVTDTRYLVRGDERVGPARLYLAGTVTPSASFREQWSILAGGVLPIAPAVRATLDLRRAHYRSVDVTVIEPGAELHSRGDRFTLAVHSINLWGEGGVHHFGWSLRGDATLGSTTRLFAGAATYPDTEAGITKQVDSAFAGIGFALTARLSAQIVADHENRHDSYRRDGVTIGLHWRFRR